MKKLFSISLVLCVFYSISQEQQMGLPMIYSVQGAVILNNGDTVYGKLRCTKIIERNYVSQIVFTNQSGDKIKYNANELIGFGIGNVYESRPSPKKGIMVFYNRLIKGKITVFQNQNSAVMSTGGHYLTTSEKVIGISFTYTASAGLIISPLYQKKTVVLKEPKVWYAGYFVEKEGGELIKINKKNYESHWSTLFGDCPGILEEIKLNPDLKKFNSFLLMTMVYNQTCD